jgi:putative Mg2+ transporter-C (MgtC) family protein
MTLETNIIVMRILLAAGLAGLLGLEREYHQKPAGLRTNMLIGIGSALFTILSLSFGRASLGSTDRIAAQILTGIGFLGAGAILRYPRTIHGLTTAATIWVNAAIGMAVGVGMTGIAVGATVVTLLVLVALTPLEAFFQRWAHRRGIKPPPAR